MVTFNHNFIPSFERHLTLVETDPNRKFYLDKINKNLNIFCSALFIDIQTAARKEVQQPFPEFKAPLVHHVASLPTPVIATIQQAFTRFQIGLTALAFNGQYKERMFGPHLRNSPDVKTVFFLAQWSYNNPFLLPQQNQPSTPSFVYTREQHHQVLWQAACKGEGTDLVLKVGTQSFTAHRCMVSLHSDVLKVLLSGRFKEGAQTEIVLEGDKPEWFSCIIYFVYNGALPPDKSWNLSSLYELRQIAAKYQVKTLLTMADDLFDVEVANLTITKDTFAAHFQMAMQSNSKTLMRKCVEFSSLSCENVDLLTQNVDSAETMGVVLKTFLNTPPPAAAQK